MELYLLYIYCAINLTIADLYLNFFKQIHYNYGFVLNMIISNLHLENIYKV